MSSPESRDQRIGSSLSIPLTYQATPFPNQLHRVSSRAQPIVQQMPVDSIIQPPSEVFSQQLHSRLQSGSQKLFEASSLSFREPGTFESLQAQFSRKLHLWGLEATSLVLLNTVEYRVTKTLMLPQYLFPVYNLFFFLPLNCYRKFWLLSIAAAVIIALIHTNYWRTNTYIIAKVP